MGMTCGGRGQSILRLPVGIISAPQDLLESIPDVTHFQSFYHQIVASGERRVGRAMRWPFARLSLGCTQAKFLLARRKVCRARMA
jgi:hypothetical protein